MATAPGISIWVPLPYGEFGAFVRDPLAFQIRLRERFGDVVRMRIGPLLVHFFFHPDHVRRVLHENQKNYLRGWHYRILRNLFGNNLLVSEGDYWLRQRRLAQPAFHRQRFAAYGAVMVDATAQRIQRWTEAAEAGTAINAGPEMSRLALAIASRTFFDRDVSADADTVGSAFVHIAEHLENRFNRPFTAPPNWVPTPANRRFNRSVRSMNELVLGLIHERRREGRDHGDLLSMLLAAKDDETGAVMTDDQVRSEVLTFLFAGHETSATALTWTWHLLATHQDVQQQVRDEIAAVTDGRPLEVADVARLVFTRAVIEESMRLFPPVWAVARQAMADDEVGGFRIPAKSTIVISQYVTQHHPDFWDRPEVFDPDRFLPAQAHDRHKGMYFPFLSGPHLCIGNEFAMVEMTLIVAAVVQRFQMASPPGPPIRPAASVALRPSAPVMLTLRAIAR